MKYSLMREWSLLMPGRGLEDILRGHKNFLGLIEGGGAAKYYYTIEGGYENLTKTTQRKYLVQENIHIPIITWIFF